MKNNTSGETAKSALLSICAWLLITLGLAGVLMGLVGLLGPEVGFVSLTVVGGIWLLLSVVPLAAIVVRSTRNNGDKWNHHPRLLGIDIMMIHAQIDSSADFAVSPLLKSA